MLRVKKGYFNGRLIVYYIYNKTVVCKFTKPNGNIMVTLLIPRTLPGQGDVLVFQHCETFLFTTPLVSSFSSETFK